jgi:hypothetical protein
MKFQSLVVLLSTASAAWYDGIDGIKVLSPSNKTAQEVITQIYSTQKTGQFNAERFAILLTNGTYHDLDIPVGYYTHVMGVGVNPADVIVKSVRSEDCGLGGGATQNFWRAAEGITVTESSCTWAVSQACPIRRMIYNGDLWLSEDGPPHWSSGGFMSDVVVKGKLHTGTQQQWFFRNTDLQGGVDYSDSGWNLVFVGTTGAPAKSSTDKKDQVTTVAKSPKTAEKPYLIQEKGGSWSIAVPKFVSSPTAGATADHGAMIGAKLSISDSTDAADGDVFVARADKHDAAAINKGIKGKKGLLLTPGIYDCATPIEITEPGFVVLGIGFPTLVATNRGEAALKVIAQPTAGVRIAGILFEAGAPLAITAAPIAAPATFTSSVNSSTTCDGTKIPSTGCCTADGGGFPFSCCQYFKASCPCKKCGHLRQQMSHLHPSSESTTAPTAVDAAPTEGLLQYGTSKSASGPHNDADDDAEVDGGFLFDIFARIGAFSYQTKFHQACVKVRADVMLSLAAPSATVDNAWLWHADHDDCGGQSDSCKSGNGLRVDASAKDVVTYGLAAEHTQADLVSWGGESGRVYFYQSELPYHDPGFAKGGFAGYLVGPAVKTHTAKGIGVYIIGGDLTVKTPIRAPASPGVAFTNMLALVIAGSGPQNQFSNHVLCLTGGSATATTTNATATNGASAATETCYTPTACNGIGCYLDESPHIGPTPSPTPPPPTPPTPPTPPPTPAPGPAPISSKCYVGADAFMPGKAGTSCANQNTKEDCARACVACTSCVNTAARTATAPSALRSGGSSCKYWKWGSNGGWCQLFHDDGVSAGWPIPGAPNSTSSVVWSGTVPGNHC